MLSKWKITLDIGANILTSDILRIVFDVDPWLKLKALESLLIFIFFTRNFRLGNCDFRLKFVSSDSLEIDDNFWNVRLPKLYCIRPLVFSLFSRRKFWIKRNWLIIVVFQVGRLNSKYPSYYLNRLRQQFHSNLQIAKGTISARFFILSFHN